MIAEYCTSRPNPAESFSDVYASYAATIKQYLYKLSGSAEDAADLTQETFIRFYYSQGTAIAARAWLYRTARNLYIDQWRSRHRVTTVSMEQIAEPQSASMDSPEELYLHEEWLEEVRDALLKLPLRDRRALMLRSQQNASYREIACSIGCSEMLVKTIIFRARARMRTLRPSGDAEDYIYHS